MHELQRRVGTAQMSLAQAIEVLSKRANLAALETRTRVHHRRLTGCPAYLVLCSVGAVKLLVFVYCTGCVGARRLRLVDHA